MEPLAASYNWSHLRKVGFRFLFLYFIVYCFPFPLDAMKLTDAIGALYFSVLDTVIKAIGTQLLHLPVTAAFSGFDKVDDSYYGITFLLVNILFSLVGAIVWGFLDTRRIDYDRLNAALQLYLRFFLAAQLLGYGFIKIFPSQFQEVTASRLVMEVGEQTPMLLAWNFMGYSLVFTGICGAIEIIAALLLFFPRTKTLGALLATVSFGFVALIDYCYNVPIKLFVTHLLMISVLLLLSDSRRLAAVLILNNPVEPMVHPPLFRKERWRKTLTIVQVLVAALIVYSTLDRALDDAKHWGRYVARVPNYGIYHTDLFIRNGDTIPPLETDSLRWKQLVIDGGSWKQHGVIKFSNDRKFFFKIETDTATHTMRIQNLSDTNSIYRFRFSQPDANHLLLGGKWKGDSIHVLLNKIQIDSNALLSTRFYIVND